MSNGQPVAYFLSVGWSPFTGDTCKIFKKNFLIFPSAISKTNFKFKTFFFLNFLIELAHYFALFTGLVQPRDLRQTTAALEPVPNSNSKVKSVFLLARNLIFLFGKVSKVFFWSNTFLSVRLMSVHFKTFKFPTAVTQISVKIWNNAATTFY